MRVRACTCCRYARWDRISSQLDPPTPQSRGVTSPSGAPYAQLVFLYARFMAGTPLVGAQGQATPQAALEEMRVGADGHATDRPPHDRPVATMRAAPRPCRHRRRRIRWPRPSAPVVVILRGPRALLCAQTVARRVPREARTLPGAAPGMYASDYRRQAALLIRSAAAK